jgi:hypothetical protein
MCEIGINICFSAAEVRWDNASIPVQPVDKSTEEFEQEALFAQDPLTTDAERIQNIVERKYCPADVSKTATECHLENTNQEETLNKLLFAPLFDGTLKNWKTGKQIQLTWNSKIRMRSLIMQEHIQSHILNNNY